MKNKFTKKEFTEIENLVECALSASSKDNARKYINKLRFLASKIDFGYNKNVYLEMVNCVDNASGRYHNELESNAMQMVNKVAIFCVDIE